MKKKAEAKKKKTIKLKDLPIGTSILERELALTFQLVNPEENI